MLIEVHMLKNFAPTNLNRDDTGAPKTCMFGGVKRSRISSQCLKRAWKTSPHLTESLGNGLISVRTRMIADIIAGRLREEGIDDDTIEEVCLELKKIGTSTKSKGEKETKKKGSKKDEDFKTQQIILYSQSDIDAIFNWIMENLGKGKDCEEITAANLQNALSKDKERPVTVDMALFGRMVTSDAFSNVDASMQVAHAISTNKVMMESDFFTAIDDLISGGSFSDGIGSAMMGDVDYNSSCYYMYSSLDVDKFAENLRGVDDCENLVKEVIPRLLETIAYTNPSGKQNTFASHSLPSAVLIEIKDKCIPVSYANAYEEPAYADYTGGIIKHSIEKFVSECNKNQKLFNIPVRKRVWFSASEDMASAVDNAVCCESFVQMIDEIANEL